jgi:hypothetical protein
VVEEPGTKCNLEGIANEGGVEASFFNFLKNWKLFSSSKFVNTTFFNTLQKLEILRFCKKT